MVLPRLSEAEQNLGCDNDGCAIPDSVAAVRFEAVTDALKLLRSKFEGETKYRRATGSLDPFDFQKE